MYIFCSKTNSVNYKCFGFGLCIIICYKNVYVAKKGGVAACGMTYDVDVSFQMFNTKLERLKPKIKIRRRTKTKKREDKN